MSTDDERQGGRKKWDVYDYFEKRFKETGNPLYVWQALDAAVVSLVVKRHRSKGSDLSPLSPLSLQSEVPEWCIWYLWTIAHDLSDIAHGRDPDAREGAIAAGGDTYERWLEGGQLELETVNRRAWRAFRLTRPGWSAFREFRSEQEAAEARAAFDEARRVGRSVDDARIEAAAALGAEDPYAYDERELRRRMNGRKRRRRKRET